MAIDESVNPYEAPKSESLDEATSSAIVTRKRRARDKVKIALICLHLTAVAYAGLGLLSTVGIFAEDASEIALGAIGFILFMSLVAAIEFLASGLRRRKFWAWVVGLIVFGVYMPSLFLPLGAIGLWALLNKKTREEFGVFVLDPKDAGTTITEP